MTAAYIVMIIVSIAVSVFNTGMSINSVAVASRNAKLRSYISDITRAVNNELKSGRLDLSKMLNLLSTRQSNALMTYLQNNPVITRSLQGILDDSEFIAQMQAEQTALENELNYLQNELAQLGYNQDYASSSQTRESDRAREIHGKVKDVTKRYNDLVTRARGYKISTTNPIKVVTDDIDARSQNIEGGIK